MHIEYTYFSFLYYFPLWLHGGTVLTVGKSIQDLNEVFGFFPGSPKTSRGKVLAITFVELILAWGYKLVPEHADHRPFI